MEPAERLRRILDARADAVAGERAGIAHLAPALAVEGSLVGHDQHFAARPGAVNARTVPHDRDDPAVGGGSLIAEELGAAEFLGDVEPHLFRSLGARSLPGGAGIGLLLGHRGVEAGAVDPQPLRAQRILGQVVREAEGVVELERGLAGQRGARGHPRGRLVEQPEAVRQRLAEARLLLEQGRLDQRPGAVQLLIGLAHLGDEHGNEPVHQRLLRAEQMRVAHRAAHDPAQDIAPALVGRQHAVRDQEARGAQMVRDHAVACLGRAGGGGMRERARLRDQRLEGVGIVIVVDALEHRGDALDPHAGVDRGPGQVADDFVGLLQILHEHQVPDLDEAVAVLVGAARGTAGDMVAVIVEDLRTRPTRPVGAHRPEIVLGGDADDPLLGQAGDPAPQIEGLSSV